MKKNWKRQGSLRKKWHKLSVIFLVRLISYKNVTITQNLYFMKIQQSKNKKEEMNFKISLSRKSKRKTEYSNIAII